MTGTVTLMQRCARWAVAALAVAGMSACSSYSGTASSSSTSSTPDVCASADALRSSLAALGDVQVVQQGTDAVQKAWTTVQHDWSQLAAAAGDRYSDQVDKVEADAGAVQSAVESTQEEATPQTLAAVATSIGAFLQEAGALVSEVRSSC